MNADSWWLKNGSDSSGQINERFVTWKNWDDRTVKNEKIRNQENSTRW